MTANVTENKDISYHSVYVQLSVSVWVNGCGYDYDYGSEHLCLTHLNIYTKSVWVWLEL